MIGGKEMQKQKEICNYLENNKNERAPNDANSAKNILRQTEKEFLIGDEVQRFTNFSARYFKIFFKEYRTDQHIVQMTPTVCFRSGYLKIDQDGTISLTDDKFEPYHSSKIFYFDQDRLQYREDWDMVDKESASSKCIKGMCALGLFAVAATVVVCQTVSRELQLAP